MFLLLGIFVQIFGQVLGQGFDQVFGERRGKELRIQCAVLLGRKHYSVQYYSDRKIYYTIFCVLKQYLLLLVVVSKARFLENL